MTTWTEVKMDSLNCSTVADATLIIPAKEVGVVLVKIDDTWIPMLGVDAPQMERGYGYVLFPSTSTFRRFPLEAQV